MESFFIYICLTGMFLPVVILFYNKGYLSANRYLAGFLFFAALYLLESFYFFYGKSLDGIAFFTTTHAFFYLIGPFSFFYVRSILNDNSNISKRDFLHYALFTLSFLGYFPYFFSYLIPRRCLHTHTRAQCFCALSFFSSCHFFFRLHAKTHAYIYTYHYVQIYIL